MQMGTYSLTSALVEMDSWQHAKQWVDSILSALWLGVKLQCLTLICWHAG